jgi:hypothetical protein
MTDRRGVIWGSQDGSNVDVGTFSEIDEILASLHDQYDTALKLWKDANESYIDIRSDYLDAYDEQYREERKKSDKITLVKADTETSKRVRSKEKLMLQVQGVKLHAEKVLNKIESQRSMAQSRVKMIISQHQFDRTGPD